jgi:hypothetical protein
MRRGHVVDWPYVIGLLLVPPILAGALFGVYALQRQIRFDEGYFTAEYQERYAAPGAVAIALERALREGDRELMQELRATRALPQDLEPKPKLIFALLLNVEGEYFDYLFFDASNYRRVIEHVREREGRYIAVEESLFYYMDSGEWLSFAAPLGATWWSLVLVFTAGTFVYRWMARYRLDRFSR